MLRKFTISAVAVCLLPFAGSVATASPQEQQAAEKPAATEKRPKDQAEYELANKTFTAAGSGDWKTVLDTLSQWKEKYPESAYKEDWIRLELRGYQNTGQREKAIEIAETILKDQPGDFESNFLITTLVPQLGDAATPKLDTGMKAASELLKGKPAGLNDQQWAGVKGQVTLAAHQTLGWSHMQRKENEKAEEQFIKILELNPNNAQVSYWLGNVVLAQNDPDKNELALYSFARAAVYEGEGALNAEGRAQVRKYLEKVYNTYAGTTDDLQATLLDPAKENPLPPADLKIKPAAVREFEKEQAFRDANPLLVVYLDLKEALLSEKGDAIWSDLKGKLTPEMALYVVGMDSARPQVLSLSSTPDGPTEVVLSLANRLRAGPARGKKLKIDGVASNLTKDPFKLSLTGGRLR